MRGASASPVGTRGGRRPSWTLRSAWGDALWVPLSPCEWRQVFQGTARDGSVSAFGSLRGFSQLCPLPGLGPIGCGRRSWTRWPGPPPGYSAPVSDRTSPLLFVSRRHPSQPAEGPEAPGGTAQPIKGRWCPDTSRTRAMPGLFLRESISRGSRSFLPEFQAANSATRLETPEPAGASPLRPPTPGPRPGAHPGARELPEEGEADGASPAWETSHQLAFRTGSLTSTSTTPGVEIPSRPRNVRY